jgi:hypothetical protein
MAAYRICSECPNPLTGKSAGAKTCSPKCRSARSRRLKKQKSEAGEGFRLPEHQKEIREMVEGATPEIAHDVIQEELRPVVRESITADTLQAIAQMVALTPEAVAALQEDLAGDDPVLRQRAYTLLLKYTVGHRAIVQPPETDKSQPLQVNFNLPRPGDDGEAPIQVESVELKTCDACGEEKPSTEFIAGSERCSDCFAKQQELLRQLNAD